MSGPVVVDRIGGWTLLRYDYDGAPLTAERADGTWLEVDRDGDIDVSSLPDFANGLTIPRAVIERLIADARARGVLTARDTSTGGA